MSSDEQRLADLAAKRTAGVVLRVARSLAATIDLKDVPETWYGILGVALRDVWRDGERYVHEMPTARVRTNPAFPRVVPDEPDPSEEPTVKIPRPR